MARRLLVVAVDDDEWIDACEHEGPVEIAGRLQAMLDEQAPGLVSYVHGYAEDAPGLIWVEVETPDEHALQEATDPEHGTPPEDAVASWLGAGPEFRLPEHAIWIADFEEPPTPVTAPNPTWPAHLGHGELSECDETHSVTGAELVLGADWPR